MDGTEKITYERHSRERDLALQNQIKQHLPDLKELLLKIDDQWGLEDLVYRMYHHSFKVYRAQEQTMKLVLVFRKIAEEAFGIGWKLNEWFEHIVSDGTGKTFEMGHNKIWLTMTRPQIEALFHAVYFARMMVKYAEIDPDKITFLPCGWAAVLSLYRIR